MTNYNLDCSSNRSDSVFPPLDFIPGFGAKEPHKKDGAPQPLMIRDVNLIFSFFDVYAVISKLVIDQPV
jgi:hypothetical protein